MTAFLLHVTSSKTLKAINMNYVQCPKSFNMSISRYKKARLLHSYIMSRITENKCHEEIITQRCTSSEFLVRLPRRPICTQSCQNFRARAIYLLCRICIRKRHIHHRRRLPNVSLIFLSFCLSDCTLNRLTSKLLKFIGSVVVLPAAACHNYWLHGNRKCK